MILGGIYKIDLRWTFETWILVHYLNIGLPNLCGLTTRKFEWMGLFISATWEHARHK